MRAKGLESSHHDASLGEDGKPVTVPAGYDGLTKALFANVVLVKSTTHGFAERALAHNVLSTSHQKMIQQSDQELSIIGANPKAGKSCTKRAPLERATPTAASSEQTNPFKDRSVQSRTSPNDRSVRLWASKAQSWLLRHTAWVLAAFHVGGDGMTAHQRIRSNPFNQHIAALGEQILFKPHKTSGPQQKLAVNWLDGCCLDFNTRSEEDIVSNKVAVTSCRSTRRRNKEERWNR